MIPSVMQQQIRQGIEDFLKTTFPVSTPIFQRIIDSLLENEGAVFKGPYLSIQLPFLVGTTGNTFFPNVPLEYPAYLHQEEAFRRLGGDHPGSTIIATGTGSGKTESFLQPILDYCYRHRGEPGIKALLIYPMNALATDQANRIADTIHRNDNLRNQITAGLYVGEKEESPNKAMTSKSIITDRETLRLKPPDILLTNYKMLDYLLIRQKDYPLWQQNTPETLQFIVVDEIHTFDGAQGTDLACLLRRLKVRLNVPAGLLCCIGTSATLGSDKERSRLMAYAADVFGESFQDDSVINESRQSAGEFLEKSLISRVNIPSPTDEEKLQDGSYTNGYRDYIRGQYKIWFDDELKEEDLDALEWRKGLVELLKGHLLFQNLLKVLQGKALTYTEVLEDLEKVTPGLSAGSHMHHINTLSSLLALLSEARDVSGRPFLNVRLQVWVRELRRMVAKVSKEPVLAFADDLTDDQLVNHLPIIHCRECGSMGWAGTRKHDDPEVNPDLQTFYISFFGKGTNVVFLFPEEGDEKEGQEDGDRRKLCCCCLRLLSEKQDQCPSCSSSELITVFVPRSIRQGKSGVYGVHDCPYCGSHNSLFIFGSQAASLASVAISQLYGSNFNNDKKLLTFSDSVQDAAHRAGFFGSRTYKFTFRNSLQRYIESEGEGLSLDGIYTGFVDHWSKQMDESAYVATFLPQDMAWLSAYDYLKRHGHLPGGSDLINCLNQRLSWEIYSEYGFYAPIGRSLEKSGASVAYPDNRIFGDFSNGLLEIFQNEIGEFRGIQVSNLHTFLAGFFMRLKNQGSIFHEGLEKYIEEAGNTYRISQIPWMPNFGPRFRAPVFLTNRNTTRFDQVYHPSRRTWCQAWAEKCFITPNPFIPQSAEVLYRLVLEALIKEGAIGVRRSRNNTIWGLEAACLHVSTKVTRFKCTVCGHDVPVEHSHELYWDNAPCLRFHCKGRYEKQIKRSDYYGKQYSGAEVQRIFAAEHTGLLSRDEREHLEARFKARGGERKPWDPNLLSCTPTLELGINIGDLSSVILCSVPPSQANYIQRIGRAGRQDGNALNLTVANGRPHDLYFYSEPKEMIAGSIDPPGVYLNASAVLERQFTAFCFDRWVESGIKANAVPPKLGYVLSSLVPVDNHKFPYNLLHYIENHQTEMFDRFIAMFPTQLDPESVSHLKRFVEGNGTEDGGLRYRILDGLHTVNRERESLHKKVRTLRDKIRKKEKDPARDQNYWRDLNELKNERGGLQALIKRINDKDLFNFLTDEGLLPNYAFPEAGVVLRSVIYRKKDAADGHGNYDHWVFEYERPAASAISELAPTSHFYAGGRKVRVDQVDMGVSEIQNWRFCNCCSHLGLVGTEDETSACPKCGSTMWSDQGQKRPMLRMRQVFATTSDQRSRIGDDSDDREPAFFNRQLLVDFEDQHITDAYRVDSEEFPFGFEFLSKAVFREINFGEKSEFGDRVVIAGIDLPRKGFTICRYCGKVQEDDHGKLEHAHSCTARDQQTERNLTDCVYLYREFSSEAIRMLLPVTTFAGSERKLHSFVAALQLGLRQKFSGRIDHLQTTLSDEPMPDSTYRKRYLVLFDTVPGGTGYLKQLMRSKEPLIEVFQKALDVLKSCSCNQDPSKDGCYRCLFVYRNSYDMKETSRNTAIELLTQIMQARDQLVKTDNLRKVSMNGLFDSELEARFIESLRRIKKEEGAVTLSKELVNGKPGYFFKIGDRAYHIELQVKLGPNDGVAVPSRADFVFWPARSQGGGKPVVLFTDGYLYHKDRLGDDLIQRMGIARSGRYHVWSLSWKDVENRFHPQGSYYWDCLSPEKAINGPSYNKFIEGYGLSRLKDIFRSDSFEWLVRYLEEPNEMLWQRYAFLHCLMHVDAKGFASEEARQEWQKKTSFALQQDIVEEFDEMTGQALLGFWEPFEDDMRNFMNVFVAVEQTAVKDCAAEGVMLACVLKDEKEQRDKPRYEAIWNGILRCYNLFQFLPNIYFITFKGMDTETVRTLLKETGRAQEEPSGDSWVELFGITDVSIHDLLRIMKDRKCPLPEAGFELIDDAGIIIGTAELAWTDLNVAVLNDEELELRNLFEDKRWVVFTIEEVMRNLDGLLQLVGQGGTNG